MIYYVTKKTTKLTILPTEKNKIKKKITKFEYKHFILAYNYKLKCQTIVI